MRSYNCVIKQIERNYITHVSRTACVLRTYMYVCTICILSFAFISYLIVSAFCDMAFARIIGKEHKVACGVVPDINRRDSTCRQFFFCIKYFCVSCYINCVFLYISRYARCTRQFRSEIKYVCEIFIEKSVWWREKKRQRNMRKGRTTLNTTVHPKRTMSNISKNVIDPDTLNRNVFSFWKKHCSQ